MPACSFCKKHFESPRGLTIFTNDGRSIFYCSSKCRRNFALGRDPKKVRWIKQKKKITGKTTEELKEEERKEKLA